MSRRQTCVSCGATSPETDSNYTLISKRHGWRLLRTVSPDGVFRAEWRCAICWSQHKSGAASPARSEAPSNGARFFFARARRFLGRTPDSSPMR